MHFSTEGQPAVYKIQFDSVLTVAISFDNLANGIAVLGGLQQIDVDPEKGVRVMKDGVTTQFADAYVALRSYWLENEFPKSPSLIDMCERNGITSDMVFAINGDLEVDSIGQQTFTYNPGGEYTLTDVKWGIYGSPNTHDFSINNRDCVYHSTERAKIPGTHHRTILIYDNIGNSGFDHMNIRRLK